MRSRRESVSYATFLTRSWRKPYWPRSGERGSDLALYRFIANKKAAVSFCAALIEEFGEFPTDPSRVTPGEPA